MTDAWAAEELRQLDLGDARLNRRVVRLVTDLAAQPAVSVPQACGDWATTKAAYRLWDHPQVTPAAIRDAHIQATSARVASQERVLVLQDTTDLDFRHHPATTGLGPLEHPAQQGLKVHSALAASLAGVPLGLVHQAVWSRDPAAVGQRHRRRQRPTGEKESQRWLTALAASQAVIPVATGLITVADREADIYDLLAQPRRPGSELLIRATHNRKTDPEGYLWDTVRQQPLLGQHPVTVGRRPDQPPRTATLTVQVADLAIAPPRHHRDRAQLAPLPMRAIWATERNPPEGTQPLRWQLLTTLPVTDLADAVQCLDWYALRWLIERYHYVLKSGCRIETLQLGTAERLERALATYELVAWRLLWLSYAARQAPTESCEAVLAQHEWQALYCTIHRTAHPPEQPPSLQQAVRWIAQLGGFLGRTRDGEPGVKTLWQGWRRLEDIAATWQLAHPSPGLMGNA